jgi:hypothetical protein
MEEKTYYVYYLIDPRDDKVFWVGKGKNDRMYQHYTAVVKGRKAHVPNKHLYNKINKLIREGVKIKYKKVYFTNDEDDAYDEEEKIIAEYGLENLCNISPGGRIDHGQKGQKGKTYEEIYGAEKAKEVKRKLSDNAKNNPNSGMKGKTHSEETTRKMSTAKKGKTLEEILGSKELADSKKKKVSETMKGRRPYIMTEEIRKKMSKSCIEHFKTHQNAFTGKTHSEETKRKMSDAKKGKTWDEIYGEEVSNRKKKKLSESLKKNWKHYFGSRK